MITVLAGLLVLVALVAPGEAGQLTPAAFLRIPIEALVGLAVLLVLPAKASRGRLRRWRGCCSAC